MRSWDEYVLEIRRAVDLLIKYIDANTFVDILHTYIQWMYAYMNACIHICIHTYIALVWLDKEALIWCVQPIRHIQMCLSFGMHLYADAFISVYTIRVH